jgi:CRP-like cAMP-binding protein
MQKVLESKIADTSELQKCLDPTMHLVRPNGEAIASVAMPIHFVYFLVAGTCRVIVSSSEGNELTLDVLPAPQIIGLSELFTGRSYFGATVYPSKDAILVQVGAKYFLTYIKEHPGCYEMLSKYFAHLAVRNMDRIERSALLAPKERFALHLLHATKGQALPYTLPEKRQDTADILHINIRTLYRYVAEFRRDGFLELVRNRIVITKDSFVRLNSKYRDFI